MTDVFEKHLDKLDFLGTTTRQEIEKVEIALGIVFPEDYKQFIEKHNGAEGSVGNSYLQFWKIEDIVKRNEGYCVNEFAPGLILIASDGDGEAYAYDTRENSMPIVNVPFISMDLDEVRFIAENLAGFFKYLYEYQWDDE